MFRLKTPYFHLQHSRTFSECYPKVSGMTGTAFTEREELKSIYGLDTILIDTHKKVL